MSCPCENNNIPFYTDCTPVTPPVTGCTYSPNSECVIYNGSDLNCLNVTTGQTLNDILSAIDTKVCNIASGWGEYDVACLTNIAGGEISSFQEFVEGISKAFCDFTGTTVTDVDTLNTGLTTVTNQVAGVLNPTLSGCTYLGINGLTSHQALIQALATKVCDLNNRITLTGVNWSQCFTVGVIPTNIPAAFSLLISQICSVKNSITGLSGTDQYVKISSTDSTAGYLESKLLLEPCLKYTKSSGNETLTLGLNFVPKQYVFNSNHFDVTPVDSGCVQTSAVSLKNTIVSDIDCNSVNTLFIDSPGAAPDRILASADNACIKTDACGIREMLFGQNPAGDYIIRVLDEVGDCTKVTLVSANSVSNPCATGWISLVSSMSTGGSGTDYTYTASAGGANNVTYSALSATYPSYRWTKDGNLEFKGAITVSSTNSIVSDQQTLKFTLSLGNVSTDCSSITPQEVFVMYKTINVGDDIGLGDITAIVSVNEAGNINVHISLNVSSTSHTHSIIVPLNSIRFNF